MYEREWEDMWDLLDREETPAFSIDNDNAAEWAVEKILDQQAERDRLLDIARSKMLELQARMDEIRQQYEKRTNFLTNHLRAYYNTVTPSSVTKTQSKYKLVSGSLVLRKQQPEYQRDEQALVAWAEGNAPDYVRIEKRIDWAGLKKVTTLDGEAVCFAESGEIIPGIVAKAREDVFEVVR